MAFSTTRKALFTCKFASTASDLTMAVVATDEMKLLLLNVTLNE